MMESFDEYYTGIQNGHQLQYPLEGSSCDLSGTFNEKRFLFNVSIVQAILLLYISNKTENNEVTVGDLKKVLDIEKKEFSKNLIPLVKKKVLLKTPEVNKLSKIKKKVEKFDDTDLLKINKDFNSKQKFVKINAFQLKENKKQVEMTTEKVLRERKFAIEALIVKLMKGEKKMKHAILIHKVLDTLNLPLTVSLFRLIF